MAKSEDWVTWLVLGWRGKSRQKGTASIGSGFQSVSESNELDARSQVNVLSSLPYTECLGRLERKPVEPALSRKIPVERDAAFHCWPSSGQLRNTIHCLLSRLSPSGLAVVVTSGEHLSQKVLVFVLTKTIHKQSYLAAYT